MIFELVRSMKSHVTIITFELSIKLFYKINTYLSPMWRRWWSSMLPLVVNFFPQIGQGYGLVFECINKCDLKFVRLLNNFEHPFVVHMNFLGVGSVLY